MGSGPIPIGSGGREWGERRGGDRRGVGRRWDRGLPRSRSGKDEGGVGRGGREWVAARVGLGVGGLCGERWAGRGGLADWAGRLASWVSWPGGLGGFFFPFFLVCFSILFLFCYCFILF